jgi:hypothetical protein
MAIARTSRLRAVVWFAAALGATIPALATAGGMKIEPGKWRFTATTDMPMSPPPKTLVECVTETEVDPDRFMAEVDACTVSDIEMDDTAMSWKLTCTGDRGSTMTGDAVYVTTGTTVSGVMTMKMRVDGQVMTMTSRTDGKRIGDCD